MRHSWNGKRIKKNNLLIKGRGIDKMDKLKILSGNACFLVQNTSDGLSKKDFEDYLINEGFEKFKKYGWKDRGCFYININSLRYSAGVPKPAPLTGTIVGESIKNPFTIEEFKTIWNILRKHIGNLDPTNEITKGTSTFLICDELLKESDNEFILYLNQENFKALNNDGYGGRGFVAVNVKSRVYSIGSMADSLVSSFIGDNSRCALTIDEFKTIWNILKVHKEDCSLETLLNQCRGSDDYYQVIECCDKILELDKDNVEGLNYKTNALFNINEYKKAIELLNHAISIYPKDYRFYNTLAFIYSDLYKFSEAINYFNCSFNLGGFEGNDRNSVYQHRAICYLKKSREDIYIKKDLNESLKSMRIYLNQFPDDEDIFRLKEKLSQGNIDLNSIISYKKLMYFECKAYKLYKLGYLEESFEAYGEVLKAIEDFNNNNHNIFAGRDRISGRPIFNADNFRWYKEVLSRFLMEFKGDYSEFFNKLFEISQDNISACVDKAKLYSLIYDENLACDYLKKLVDACPKNNEANDFYDRLTEAIKRDKHLSECAKFKDYTSIEEYIEDVKFCLIHSCRYSEESAENFAKVKKDEIEECYYRKYPADDLAMDYYPLCG